MSRLTHKRPLPVTLIGILFLLTGIVGLADVATRVSPRGPFQHDLLWIGLVRLLAVVGAVFLFRAHNWARWLLVARMAFHVALSAFHPLRELLIHAALFAAITYFLFRRPASLYFCGAAGDAREDRHELATNPSGGLGDAGG